MQTQNKTHFKDLWPPNCASVIQLPVKAVALSNFPDPLCWARPEVPIFFNIFGRSWGVGTISNRSVFVDFVILQLVHSVHIQFSTPVVRVDYLNILRSDQWGHSVYGMQICMVPGSTGGRNLSGRIKGAHALPPPLFWPITSKEFLRIARQRLTAHQRSIALPACDWSDWIARFGPCETPQNAPKLRPAAPTYPFQVNFCTISPCLPRLTFWHRGLGVMSNHIIAGVGMSNS